MSDKPFKDPWHPEQDRLWAAHDETNKAMQALEARVLILETDPRQQRVAKLTVDIERPTRQVGDYLPDPVSGWVVPSKPGVDLCGRDELSQKLDQVRAILADFLPPSGSGCPSPAQRIVLRIIETVGLGGEP